MNLDLPIDRAENYTSASQRIRVMTEHWVNRSVFCPNCGNALTQYGNNRPVADFYCDTCSEEYELKSKNGHIGRKIVDGAYSTMIQRLDSETNPNFFFLTYDNSTFGVRNFLTIPKYFFVPDVIERRQPLGHFARRAGWTGCNIVMSSIPELGKIYYVREGIAQSRTEVMDKWRQTAFVRSTSSIEAKGWLLDVLVCIEKIKKRQFSLSDVYEYEGLLQAKHPSNRNIRAKVRQQLQILRDKDLIEFLGRGNYRVRTTTD